LYLSDEAKAVWVAAYNEIELAQGLEGAFEDIKPTASKAAENTARIAGVLTLVSDPAAQRIPAAAMAQAVELTRFYLGEAVRLKTVAEQDVELSKARLLLDWLHRTGAENVSLNALSIKAPRATRARGNAAAMRKLATVLVEHGWLRPLPAGALLENERPVNEAWAVAQKSC
jgi:hypothetical protein